VKDKIQEYEKIPVKIQAVQWTGSNFEEVFKLTGAHRIGTDSATKNLLIPTLEGEMRADVGDYIIKGIKGEVYPCKPDIFEMTYKATNSNMTYKDIKGDL
jgi:hypothetical protein